MSLPELRPRHGGPMQHRFRGFVLSGWLLACAALLPFPRLGVERALAQAGEDAYQRRVPASTIVLDASDFLDEIPRGHTITTASALRVPWLFNNTALELRTRSNYLKRIEIEEPGVYHLYVRSHGAAGSTLRVAVGDRVIEDDVGNEPLTFKRAGRFELDAGPVEIRLLRPERTPVFDALVLTKDDAFTETELRSLQLPDEVALLRSYTIPPASAVKFGDLTGDGRMDFVVLTSDYSAIAFDHDGNELWSYRAPAPFASARASFEAPGLVWDFDRDGRSEVVHWRMEDEQEFLVIADGATGEVRHRVSWPTLPLPHDYSNFRLAVGSLSGGYPGEILVFTDAGVYGDRQPFMTITAYDASLEMLWQRREDKLKDHLGHYVYPVDLTGNGRDEVVLSALVLDAEGRELWNRFDLFYMNHDHADSYRFADITGDGRQEMISAHSEIGVVVTDAANGEILWQNTAEHTQQLEVGHFLAGAPGPHVAAGARTYGNRDAGEAYLWSQVFWFDAHGALVRKWPTNPLNGNPVFVKGDWYGEGSDALFWYKFRLTDNGSGTLYFEDPVYHMFDFVGNGAADVITMAGNRLRVYGYRGVPGGQPPLTRDPDYRKNNVANHTHY